MSQSSPTDKSHERLIDALMSIAVLTDVDRYVVKKAVEALQTLEAQRALVLSSTARISDRCEKCPSPKDGCIFPRCGEVSRETLERLVIKAALDLFGVTSSAAFKLPVPNTTPPLFVTCGEETTIAPSAIERRTEIPAELFDGMAVYIEAERNAGPDHALKSNHVSAVLNAVVRLIRKRQREQSDISRSHQEKP